MLAGGGEREPVFVVDLAEASAVQGDERFLARDRTEVGRHWVGNDHPRVVPHRELAADDLIETEPVGSGDLDPADQDRLGALIVSAQVGSLLDQRIAQLAVSGDDPGPQASARKLIGVRYRQDLAEFRMELSAGGGLVPDDRVFDFLNTRCLTIAGGSEQILLTLAGERLLGLPR